MILSSFGRPRQYRGLATKTTCFDRSQRANLNGPMPTGNELYGTLLMLGYCANRCLGRMLGFAQQLEKKVAVESAYCSFRWNTTVNLSGSSTLAILSRRSASLF